MTAVTMIVLAIVGFIAGIASGMFGIGGGVIIVPALILLLDFTQLTANGTSLAALLMPVSLFAVIAYYRAGKLKIPVAAWMALGLFIGGYFGATWANDLPGDTLKRMYGVFLLYMGWRFAEPRKYFGLVAQGEANKKDDEAAQDVKWYILLAVGLLAGVMAGLFGIGGGAIIVPALVAFLKFDHKQAVGTSLAALLPPNIPVLIPYYTSGQLQFETALFVALGLVVGAFAGAKIALGLPSGTIKRLYGFFLLFIGLRFLLG